MKVRKRYLFVWALSALSTIGFGQEGGGSEAAAVEAPAVGDAPAVETDEAMPIQFNRRFLDDGQLINYSIMPAQQPQAPKVAPPTIKKTKNALRVLLKGDYIEHKKSFLDALKKFLTNLLARLLGIAQRPFAVSSVTLDVRSVEVVPQAGGAPIVIANYGTVGQQVEMIGDELNAPFQLGFSQIPFGQYSKVRIYIGDKNKAMIDEGNGPQQKSLGVDKKTQYVELAQKFTISQKGFTSIKVKFDVEKSVKRKLLSTQFQLTPVMAIESVEVGTKLSQTVHPNEDSSFGVVGEFEVKVPAGAVSAPTDMFIENSYSLRNHNSEHAVAVGHEFVVGPANVNFNAPVNVSLRFVDQDSVALGLDDESVRPALFNSESKRWEVIEGAQNVDGLWNFDLLRSGAIAFVAAVPATGLEVYGNCSDRPDSLFTGPSEHGFDLRNFDISCQNYRRCLYAGSRTYGLSAAACQQKLQGDLSAQCGKIVAGYPHAQELSENCQQSAAAFLQYAIDHQAQEVPAVSLQICDDYDDLGISCERPSCSLLAAPGDVPADVPATISFNIVGSGSLTHVNFEGQTVYSNPGVAVAGDFNFEVRENNRVLSDAKTFAAELYGPGTSADDPVRCEVTVNVVRKPPACVITLSPDVLRVNEISQLVMTVQPGYNQAFLDLRTETLLVQVGLGTADELGRRQFKSAVRAVTTRGFHGMVRNTATGEQVSCEAGLTVLP